MRTNTTRNSNENDTAMMDAHLDNLSYNGNQKSKRSAQFDSNGKKKKYSNKYDRYK